jgi:hypothetical protein
MLRTAALVLAALMLTGLTGCTASYVYVRADGRDFAEDQALYQQFETDRMTCQGEGHSGNIPSNAAHHSTGDVGGNARDCMGKKGYTVVQSDVAELKRQDLAAKAAEKAQREAAAAAPPPAPGTPQACRHETQAEAPGGIYTATGAGAGGLSTPGGKLASVTTGTGAFDARGTDELARAANPAWLIARWVAAPYRKNARGPQRSLDAACQRDLPPRAAKAASGACSMSLSSARAGPRGERLPCSQLRTVSTGTPMRAANTACVSPVRPRTLRA